MIRSLPSIVCLVLVAGSLAGCGGTYVNIPPENGDVAAHDPNNSTVRQVMVIAVRNATQSMNKNEHLSISTPPGTTVLTEAAVARLLGPRFVEAGVNGVSPKADIAVTGVRIRGTSASVDVARPSPAGGRQLVTVSMNWQPFNGWSVVNTQMWHNIPLAQLYNKPRPIKPIATHQPTTQPMTQPEQAPATQPAE